MLEYQPGILVINSYSLFECPLHFTSYNLNIHIPEDTAFAVEAKRIILFQKTGHVPLSRVHMLSHI